MMEHRVVTIGRGAETDIRLADDSVSRLHAELVVSAGGLLHVADRSSTNGTWIRCGGQWERVRQRMVEPLDRLRLGEYPFTIQNFRWLIFFGAIAEVVVRSRRANLEASQIDKGLLPEDEETMLRLQDLGVIRAIVGTTHTR